MTLSRIYPLTLAAWRARGSIAALGAMATGACLLSGCLFGGDKEAEILEDRPIQVTACADLQPVQKATADSLVKLANVKMSTDMEYMFSDSVNEWKDVKSRSPQEALKLYDQALTVAPGHCGAKFGRAVASTMMTTQDGQLNAFITKAEKAGDTRNNPQDGLAKTVGTSLGLLKLSPDQAAPELLKLSANIEQLDYPTVTEFQSLVETTLMPKVDSAIASLEQALNYDSFTFEFTTEELGLVQIDQGEIGPLLGGLKVVKAWLTVAAGYQWELAVNGKYAWIDSLNFSDETDFDHLRPGQIAALDYVTGLFKTSSPFSRIKPTWKARVNGIPALLLSGVENAQKGLTYAINEAKSNKGQEHDLYVVGTGPDADVDPADLQDAIDLLERAKKYLNGEVNITYSRGIRSLKVNFPKIFAIDGIQSQLPYFQFRPYAEWNDTVKADTTWFSGMYNSPQEHVMEKLGYAYGMDYGIQNQPIYQNLTNRLLGYELTVYPEYDPQEPFKQREPIVLAAYSVIEEGSCTFNYEKFYERVLVPGAVQSELDSAWSFVSPYKSVAKNSKGTFTLKACRETDNGVEYVGYIDAITKSPFYFTNPAGTLTVDITDLEKYSDDIPALKDKIFFRDPTFGGLFPELTQATIWDVITSMRNIDIKQRRVCKEITLPGGDWDYECKNRKASELSDLDLLVSTLEMMDGPL